MEALQLEMLPFGDVTGQSSLWTDSCSPGQAKLSVVFCLD
jgi:hypothetical protein